MELRQLSHCALQSCAAHIGSTRREARRSLDPVSLHKPGGALSAVNARDRNRAHISSVDAVTDGTTGVRHGGSRPVRRSVHRRRRPHDQRTRSIPGRFRRRPLPWGHLGRGRCTLPVPHLQKGRSIDRASPDRPRTSAFFERWGQVEWSISSSGPAHRLTPGVRPRPTLVGTQTRQASDPAPARSPATLAPGTLGDP